MPRRARRAWASQLAAARRAAVAALSWSRPVRKPPEEEVVEGGLDAILLPFERPEGAAVRLPVLRGEVINRGGYELLAVAHEVPDRRALEARLARDPLERRALEPLHHEAALEGFENLLPTLGGETGSAHGVIFYQTDDKLSSR